MSASDAPLFWLCPPQLLPPLVLASASPRRRELLAHVGLTFVVDSADIPELALPGESPAALVERLAREKGLAVAPRHAGAWVLSADTLVVLDDVVLGKPRDAEEAADMLQQLSGRWHEVYTGWAITPATGSTPADGLVAPTGAASAFDSPRGESKAGHVRTRVLFHDLTREQILAYVAGGEPLDKAGAYGIQECGALLVAALDGDYFNVMGLPLSTVCRELAALACAGAP